MIRLLSYLISWYRLGLTRVYVSAYDIGEREKIDKLYLKTILVPKAYVSDDIYLEEKDIVNKYTKLNVIVPKGSLFYKSFLEDFSDMKDSSHLLLEDNQVTYDLYVKDIDVNPALAVKYGVSSIPTLIVIENGEVKNTSVGLISKSEVEALVK